MPEGTEYAAGGETFQLRCLQAVAGDPLFDGARTTVSVESGDAGFEVVVELSPYFVHLLTVAERLRLRELSMDLVRRLLDSGVRADARIRVSSNGVALHDGQELATLLPLSSPG